MKKTAKTLRPAVPQSVRLRADEVIEWTPNYNTGRSALPPGRR